jgi:pimeloyl-ACP methyl ester carboxylesterase
MALVRAGQVELNTVEVGQGKPLLLVHGFPLSHAMWRGQIDGLASRARIVAPDLRGFGASSFVPGASPEDGVTMAQYADDLAALLDALAIDEPVVFCGLSMGGYVAWQFWKRHARRLAGLVLCDTRAAADTPEAAKGRRTMAERVLKEGPIVAAEAMLPKLFSRVSVEKQPQIVESTRQTILSARSEAIAAAQRGMAVRPDMTGELASIRVPALLIGGAEDAISPPAEMRSIAAAMPDARFVEIPQAGHMAPLESPASVNSQIAEFLAGV